MRPEILLIEPMMAPIEASLDENYHVHRLFEAQRTNPLSREGAARRAALGMSGVR
jgi:hypothetical protein